MILACLLLLTCPEPPHPIIGTWREVSEGRGEIEATFYQDGKYKSSRCDLGTWAIKDGILTIVEHTKTADGEMNITTTVRLTPGKLSGVIVNKGVVYGKYKLYKEK